MRTAALEIWNVDAIILGRPCDQRRARRWRRGIPRRRGGCHLHRARARLVGVDSLVLGSAGMRCAVSQRRIARGFIIKFWVFRACNRRGTELMRCIAKSMYRGCLGTRSTNFYQVTNSYCSSAPGGRSMSSLWPLLLQFRIRFLSVS